MIRDCLNCQKNGRTGSILVRNGSFFRLDDARRIQRFFCKACGASPSASTGSRWFRAKKRRLHEVLRKDLASLGGIRRLAKNKNLNRKTVARKLLLLGEEAKEYNLKDLSRYRQIRIAQFDELETFEHSKCKPLSVAIFIQQRTRRILGFQISSMPAKGLLVKKARRYGYRPDDRIEGLHKLFAHVKPHIHRRSLVKSDSNPNYPSVVKRHLPNSIHRTFISRRGTLSGGGEIKKGGWDPIFGLNHTCASMRMSITRLVRKTWYTTKRAHCLEAHLHLYVAYHNKYLVKKVN